MDCHRSPAKVAPTRRTGPGRRLTICSRGSCFLCGARIEKGNFLERKLFCLEIDQPQVVVRRQRRIGQLADVMTEATEAHVLLAHRHQPADVIVGLVVEQYARIGLADKVRNREERRADAHHECTCKNNKSNHDLIEAIYRAWPQSVDCGGSGAAVIVSQ